jgi:ABC-type antimicrobial peptide transport system permease subunit
VLLALSIGQFSATFSSGITSATLTFDFHVRFAIALEAMLFAPLIGLAGGWLPARRGMQKEIVDSLRKV